MRKYGGAQGPEDDCLVGSLYTRSTRGHSYYVYIIYLTKWKIRVLLGKRTKILSDIYISNRVGLGASPNGSTKTLTNL